MRKRFGVVVLLLVLAGSMGCSANRADRGRAKLEKAHNVLVKACGYAAEADAIVQETGAVELIDNAGVDLTVDTTRTVLEGGCAVVYAAEAKRQAELAAGDGD